MLKNGLLAGAGLLITALLVYLAIQSSAIDSEYYVDHGSRVNLLRQSETDFSSLSEAIQNAYREGRAVPNSAIVTLQRLDSTRAELGAMLNADTDAKIRVAFASYSKALEATTQNVRAFVEQQRTLADSVVVLRTESPSVVRNLRQFGMQALSQTVFGLAVEVMDYAGGTGTQARDSLAQRVQDLAGDETIKKRIPGQLDNLISASQVILDGRGEASETLSAVEASAVPGASRTLQATLREVNKFVVGRADRARTLLAVLSILFLAGIAYTLFKLRSSYSDLSENKTALEQLNHSLEERVDARTEQLTTAYEELKESQMQLVQAEKMSSLGELVAGISHEINTPLWYLLSNASMLQERIQSFAEFAAVAEELLDQLRRGDKDKQKFVERLQEMDNLLLNEGLTDDLEESADLIRDSIEGLEQLAEMSKSLKDFSRLDRAAVDRFSVNEGLDKSLLIAKNFLKNRVTVVKNFADVPPIMCAPGQINQIFLNLIKNASDAIENQGTITLTTRHEDDYVFISVQDTGCGIPQEVMAKIRDPFFTTKEVGKGTGLGLSISEKIIKSHFGDLTIDSAEGEGSTFTVKLPVNKRPDGEPADDLEAQLDALDDMPLAAAS